MMQALIVGAVAAIAGILIGFWLRSASARGEKAQLEQRDAELARDLSAAKDDLTQAQSESAARAGFEALAIERENTIERIVAERETLREEARSKAETERNLVARVKELEAELRNERQNTAEKLAVLDRAEKAFIAQFETLANNILDKKSDSFSTTSQKELSALIDPLKTQIKDFREKVEEAQSDSKTGVTKLETLIGTLSGLNEKLSEEAHNLTRALRRSPQEQGFWGEEITRDLLELGGLREGVQYRVQQSFDAPPDEDASRTRKPRPDFVVYLPGDRNLIIDCKVSLNAYDDSVKAETDIERKDAIRRHLESVRNHVDELSSRAYHKLQALESPDFVVMFIPIEPAFLVALHEDGKLWRYAYEKQILLVGPTTLLFVIRIVDNLYKQELQARSVRDVMDRGAKLYEKFVGFVADIEAIGKSLRGASETYEEAKRKLSGGPGNLVRQVEMLKQLGIRTGKSLPQNLLDAAAADELDLALAADTEQSDETEP